MITTISLFLYKIGTSIYFLLIHTASYFNHKAELWVAGRKKLFEKIESGIGKNEKIAWFHCASLGEFEQGRPLMEEFRLWRPDYKILLTFFSPSGYEVRKNYTGADYIFYLPADTKSNARRFLKIVKPSFAVFVKYEFWYYYLSALKQQNIPVYLVSAIFQPGQVFFHWYGKWYLSLLHFFEQIFVQDAASEQLLVKTGVRNVTVAGDTRFDRVYNIARHSSGLPVIEQFCHGWPVLVAGSTWPKDEELIAGYFHKYGSRLKLVIAPHEISNRNIERIEKLFVNKTLRYSQAGPVIDNSGFSVLIIDNVGMLSAVYRYGTMAYIGGGFGKGIHNILEAATYGSPVIFGPVCQKFREAADLIRLGGAASVNNAGEFDDIMNEWLSDEDVLSAKSTIAREYVRSNTGATDIILKAISQD